jgi:hypothetical protein
LDALDTGRGRFGCEIAASNEAPSVILSEPLQVEVQESYTGAEAFDEYLFSEG